jgi:hypothetical protein
MRFIWFNPMPWPHRPEDLREGNGSVWVDIPSTLYDPKAGHCLYHAEQPDALAAALASLPG